MHDLALAALRAKKLGIAAEAAERALHSAPPELRASCEFLRANVAFAQSELAAAQATGPEAEPFAFDVAIGFA